MSGGVTPGGRGAGAAGGGRVRQSVRAAIRAATAAFWGWHTVLYLILSPPLLRPTTTRLTPRFLLCAPPCGVRRESPGEELQVVLEREGLRMTLPFTPGVGSDGVGRAGISLAANSDIVRHKAGSLPEVRAHAGGYCLLSYATRSRVVGLRVQFCM